MKQVVLEFDDEEMELLEEQFKQIQDVAGMETIEDYIYYATMSHCKTMQVASKMFGQSGDIEKLMADENVHVGVVNMPIQLSNVEDKDEFSRYLNDVLNDAVKDFMNRNNELKKHVSAFLNIFYFLRKLIKPIRMIIFNITLIR